VSRPKLEIADILRDHGAAWRSANAGHVSLDQLKVMSAIERCRTAALGGHVERCEKCAHTVIAYNSCRNRHCPKCQAAAAQRMRSGCCARAASGHAAVAPPRRLMNSRRRISEPKVSGQHCIGSNQELDRAQTEHQNQCRSAQPMSLMGRRVFRKKRS
jgi:Transposase zinc-binding domain